MQNENLAYLRSEYSGYSLDTDKAPGNPLELFRAWFEEVQKLEVPDPNAMVLGTFDGQQPHSRIVLLKAYGPEGFSFYTNYESHKAREIANHPNASLLFFWRELHRQVRILGGIEKTSREDSQAYFATRPRRSQIGAWASHQSQPLGSRQELEQRVKELEAAYEGQEISCPPNWGGYLLRPHYFEFWQGRESRLHDRLVYESDGSQGWKKQRLYP